MNNLSPEQRLKMYKLLNAKDGIEAMRELLARKKEHQKSMKEFVK